MSEQISILQVSPADLAGGAEKIAWNLCQTYETRGHQSWLAVGQKYSDDPKVISISAQETKFNFRRKLNQTAHAILGIENFSFPETWNVLNRIPERPHIIHLHNLHGDFFDLRALPWLGKQAPLFVTLHDAWLFSGHCAHSLVCERWRTGCGECQALDLYPAVFRDATAFNWQRKQKIFKESRIYLATPSEWLMKKAQASMLADSVIESRIIPNGIDLSIFQPGSQSSVRQLLGIDQNVSVLLFCANLGSKNTYKDYETVKRAAELVSRRFENKSVILIVLGEKAAPQKIGNLEIRFVSYEKNSHILASYYQASDLYVHAAKAETWGLSITEALACGVPVVVTAVGGISEQIRSMIGDHEEPNGVLVEPQNARAMADAIEHLLEHESLRNWLGQNARKSAEEKWSLEFQADAYLAWYQEILTPNTALHYAGACQ